MVDFTVRLAQWPNDAEALRGLRNEVFVVEQGVPQEIEWDGCDEHCLHIIAENMAGQAIGTGRLMPEGKIGRMAVAKNARGMGVGGAILKLILEYAQTLLVRQPKLNAQAHAQAFYEAAGFEPIGEQFQEAGIAHQAMQATLTPTDCIIPASHLNIALHQLVKNARHRGWVIDQQLETSPWNCNANLLQAVTQQCQQQRHFEIRFFSKSEQPIRQSSGSLWPLFERLKSRLKLNIITTDQTVMSISAFEHQGLLLLNAKGDGEYISAASPRYKTVMTEYQHIINHSTASLELKTIFV